MLYLSRKMIFLIALLIAFWHGSTCVSAQSSSGRSERGLSQLGFDEGPVTTDQADSPPVLDTSDIEAMVQQAYSGTITRIPEFITPNLSGVEADDHNQRTISSSIRWAKTAGGSCENAPGNAEICKKVRSMQDVLKRFTGDNGFFGNYCTKECPDGKAVIIEIKSDSTDTTLIRREQAGLCSFEINTRDPGSWKVLHASEIECICPPANCLNGSTQ